VHGQGCVTLLVVLEAQLANGIVLCVCVWVCVGGGGGEEGGLKKLAKKTHCTVYCEQTDVALSPCC
jgi:hypothetical protein